MWRMRSCVRPPATEAQVHRRCRLSGGRHARPDHLEYHLNAEWAARHAVTALNAVFPGVTQVGPFGAQSQRDPTPFVARNGQRRNR